MSGPPRISLPRGARQALIRTFGLDLRRAQARLRRQRQVLRSSLELRGSADRFCRAVEQAERPAPDSSTGRIPSRATRSDYVAAGALLRKYLAGTMAEDQLCTTINRRLSTRRARWQLSPIYRGRPRPRVGSHFELDKGDGALDAWRHLAVLLGSGAALGRMRVCPLSTCKRLFYDASPPAKRSACSKKHKDILAARRYRTARSRGR